MNSVESNSVISEPHRNTVVQGNCNKVMRQFRSASVDLVLTDPPYLVNYASNDGRTVPNYDNDAWLKPAFAEIYRVLSWNRCCVSFYAWNRADRFVAALRDAGFHIACHLAFIKKYASRKRFLAYSHENAYLLAKGSPSPPTQPLRDAIERQYSGNRLHPTQKPLCLLRRLIESFSLAGDVVLDPFCGSGSTLLAARELDRRFLGIELDARYYTVGCDRLCERQT